AWATLPVPRSRAPRRPFAPRAEDTQQRGIARERDRQPVPAQRHPCFGLPPLFPTDGSRAGPGERLGPARRRATASALVSTRAGSGGRTCRSRGGRREARRPLETIADRY